jgi:hypothetical protein
MSEIIFFNKEHKAKYIKLVQKDAKHIDIVFLDLEYIGSY